MSNIFYQEGYKPEKDRIPPAAINFKACGCLMFGALMVLVVGFFIINAVISSQNIVEVAEIIATSTNTATSTSVSTEAPRSTETPTLTNTLSNDELIATAHSLMTATPIPPTYTATSTPDYCYFLTPTVTPTLTPLPLFPDATPNAYQVLATATMLAIIQTPTSTPTISPPIAWCNEYLMMRSESANDPETTDEPVPAGTPIGGFPSMPAIPAPPTWTPIPAVALEQSQPQIIERIVEVTVMPLPIQVIITQPPVIMIITSTPISTDTPTNTPTDTETQTPTPTETASATTSPTATSTATATATVTPTDYIYPTPREIEPAFIWDRTEDPLTLRFINYTVGNVVLEWDFQSDGIIDEITRNVDPEFPLFTFPSQGVYMVTLTAYASSGVRYSTTIAVQVPA